MLSTIASINASSRLISGLCVGLNGFADAVKFLLNAEVGEGGDTQFRGDIGAYLIVCAISLGQFLMKGQAGYLCLSARAGCGVKFNHFCTSNVPVESGSLIAVMLDISAIVYKLSTAKE